MGLALIRGFTGGDVGAAFSVCAMPVDETQILAMSAAVTNRRFDFRSISMIIPTEKKPIKQENGPRAAQYPTGSLHT